MSVHQQEKSQILEDLRASRPGPNEALRKSAGIIVQQELGKADRPG